MLLSFNSNRESVCVCLSQLKAQQNADNADSVKSLLYSSVSARVNSTSDQRQLEFPPH
jgi:hypothetical protein